VNPPNPYYKGNPLRKNSIKKALSDLQALGASHTHAGFTMTRERERNRLKVKGAGGRRVGKGKQQSLPNMGSQLTKTMQHTIPALHVLYLCFLHFPSSRFGLQRLQILLK
jgi:hypothetical protein